MECCAKEDDELVCTAGSNTAKLVVPDDGSPCKAMFNGQSCTCEYCDTGNRTQTVTIVGYDCTAVGGTQRTCPDAKNADFWSSALEDVIDGDGIQGTLKYLGVDPRTGSENSGAFNGFMPTLAVAVSSLVSVGLLF
eukprot:scaffold5755_cov72-Cylindrotheca_fusiformis.AAC.2